MASPVNPPRGMRDFLPAQKLQRDRVLDSIRRTYRLHGFDEIETPVVEDSARLHSGLGGDNEKLAFAVMRRGLTVDDLASADDPSALSDLGLRFDLTVPLARFYGTHRAELPAVFRSIQIASVWRAERPQKGRYRQFVQCDIDVIGEAGVIAEVELITATAAALDALGVVGTSIRINDRRLLTSALTALGFPASEHDAALITIDKLDKLGADGVVAELADRAFPAGPVAELERFLRRSASGDDPITAESISGALPAGIDPDAAADVVAIAAAVDGVGPGRCSLRFDPWLVRGMGYYTGPIFEVEHPDLSSSIGGGGRYDGMIGRFLGTQVPAAGFSLGFERLIELVDAAAAGDPGSVALIYDPAVDPATVVGIQRQLIGAGRRVRIDRRPKNIRPLLEQLAVAGFAEYALVGDSSTIEMLEFVSLAAG